MNATFKQYSTIKEKYKDAILLFRVGAVYQTFNEDAKVLSIVTGTALANGGEDAEIKYSASLPSHSLDTTLSKLVKAGYKVGICDQLEAPTPAKSKRNSSAKVGR